MPVSIQCFSEHCPKQDNKVVISLSSILRLVISIWLQNIVSVDDNFVTKVENKIVEYTNFLFNFDNSPLRTDINKIGTSSNLNSNLRRKQGILYFYF